MCESIMDHARLSTELTSDRKRSEGQKSMTWVKKETQDQGEIYQPSKWEGGWEIMFALQAQISK